MGKLARQQHFPVIVARRQGVEVCPVPRFGQTRRRRSLDLNRRLGGDSDFRVGSRNVEVMHRVSGEIAVLRDIGRRVHVEMEAEAALSCFAPRLHAHFHHALAHCRSVAKNRRMSNGIDHWIIGSLNHLVIETLNHLIIGSFSHLIIGFQ